MADEEGQGSKPRGPDPDRLIIEEETWEKAVEKALKKKPPPEGWPKPAKPTHRKRKRA